MPKPLIHSRRGFVTASSLLDAAGAALKAIKEEDKLTWVDVGAAIGISDDQAAKYADGMATMNFITFFRACVCWNGRFANSVFGLGDLHLSESAMPDNASDIHAGIIALMELMLGLQKAMLDGKLQDEEIEELDQLIEAAGEMLDGLRNRLAHIRADDKPMKVVGE